LPLQKRKKIRELVAHLAPVDDHIDCALLEQELSALKAFGELLAHGLLDNARPAKPMSARGSAITTSPIMAKLADTPPMVGSVRTVMNGALRPVSCVKAAVVLAICMSEKSPSSCAHRRSP